jgi:hypothetical protein
MTRPTAIISKSDRQIHFEFSAFGFVECAAAQARAQQVQFCLTHRAFQAEQEAIVKMRGIIDTVFVQD